MKKMIPLLLLTLLFASAWADSISLVNNSAWADSISLVNNAEYTLTAKIVDANGNVVGEYVLGPRDAWEWSNDFDQFGTEWQSSPASPYSVQWYCTRGSLYGTCENVAPGGLVSAQDCGGMQDCSESGDDY